MKLKKCLVISLAILLVFGSAATVFAASGEQTVTPRGRTTFTVTCYRWEYTGGMTKTTPYASGYIEPRSVTYDFYITGTIAQQVGSDYQEVRSVEGLTVGSYNTVAYGSGYGAAGSMCKAKIRNAEDTNYQITVTGYWDAA